MYDKIKYLQAGDQAVNIEFGNEISEEINRKIRAMTLTIEKEKIEGIVEVVPTYRSLMIHYNPLKVEYKRLINKLKELESNLENIDLPAPEVIEIPTLYGGEYGPDIEKVASYNELSIEEVIQIHSSKEYLIYMLGFTPGFSYLGGMDQRIATPRLSSPRTKIPGGSVGIAGKQTGIYPIDSPGGWQLIGRTPLKLFDPQSKNPILLKAGNYVVFKPIGKEEYERIKNQVERRTYCCHCYSKKDWGDFHGKN
ncbi:5-oxoprolinase subunit PxpB [Garciella nitratireducens]|uniref:Sensor histidine kinase inhibitor, KipI family n=1 Tax=Garciella nitratireducens DSM 15102 TaxID=1121911 RepID=A0A1T4P1Z4_9FIRM|nr:5-oxoprolinase subunit PxpB [Garciella nitratireducens]SJZ85461.1 sensor histidine kinase inhibitor, KipI family [Garciella nitratireducens DSM 15102]